MFSHSWTGTGKPTSRSGSPSNTERPLGHGADPFSSLADAELRLGGDLVEQLIAGADADAALAHARALGWKIEGPHNVVVVGAEGQAISRR